MVIFFLQRRTIRVIDVAGHARVRSRVSQWVQKVGADLGAIVFVVDADHFEPRPVAE